MPRGVDKKGSEFIPSSFLRLFKQLVDTCTIIEFKTIENSASIELPEQAAKPLAKIFTAVCQDPLVSTMIKLALYKLEKMTPTELFSLIIAILKGINVESIIEGSLTMHRYNSFNNKELCAEKQTCCNKSDENEIAIAVDNFYKSINKLESLQLAKWETLRRGMIKILQDFLNIRYRNDMPLDIYQFASFNVSEETKETEGFKKGKWINSSENNAIVQFQGSLLGFDFDSKKAIEVLWNQGLNAIYRKLTWESFIEVLSNSEKAADASFLLIDSLGKYTMERYLDQLLNYGDEGKLIGNIKRATWCDRIDSILKKTRQKRSATVTYLDELTDKELTLNHTDDNYTRIENRDYLERLANDPCFTKIESKLLNTWIHLGFENGDQPTLAIIACNLNISRARASQLLSNIRSKLSRLG